MTLLTEQEAREKWCAFSRVSLTFDDLAKDDPDNRFSSEHSINRYSNWPDTGKNAETHPACRCIASDCMSWRWNYSEQYTELEPPRVVAGTRLESGYCGLAGAPK